VATGALAPAVATVSWTVLRSAAALSHDHADDECQRREKEQDVAVE
jgi:hypothetical protein